MYTDAAMTCADDQHEWVPAPAWLLKDAGIAKGTGPIAAGYARQFCWRCRLVVDVLARKEVEIVGGVYPFRRTRKDGAEVLLPGAHGTVTGIKADCDRLNEATLKGWPGTGDAGTDAEMILLRMPSDTVRQPKNFGGSAKNMIADADRAKQSAGEDAMAELLDSLGIRYIRQAKYIPMRKLRADFHLSGRNILVEIVGGVFPFKRTRKDGSEVTLPGAHGTVAGIRADNKRLNEATLAGYRILRFLPQDVTDGTARAVLKRLL